MLWRLIKRLFIALLVMSICATSQLLCARAGLLKELSGNQIALYLGATFLLFLAVLQWAFLPKRETRAANQPAEIHLTDRVVHPESYNLMVGAILTIALMIVCVDLFFRGAGLIMTILMLGFVYTMMGISYPLFILFLMLSALLYGAFDLFFKNRQKVGWLFLFQFLAIATVLALALSICVPFVFEKMGFHLHPSLLIVAPCITISVASGFIWRLYPAISKRRLEKTQCAHGQRQ